ncbi:transcriptional regulator [Aliidongia dinghuensis]|uniref:Transcriptional regulator n=1 Tax=Aliidongia dinghuensis TaxID=1867774 RepID=A0A8J2YXR2_9PROT|nr:GntR family transcriptional regulator [Aliidongia dinghuensis]GGF34414.1 transcriptional regulator [Aliidongia dinghuensis]
MATRPPSETAEILPHPSAQRLSLAELAYERLEAQIVRCGLRPGAEVTLQDIQALIGLGRTPVHEAVKRLAADTLLSVRPRAGLRVMPIDLAREATLLQLRREMERFVVSLAALRASAAQRSQMMRLARKLRERRDVMTVDEFNVYDRLLDRILLEAAAEPFLAHTLRPLHTMFRRTGWLYLTHVGTADEVKASIDGHIPILDAVIRQNAEAAKAASDLVIGLAGAMVDRLEQEIDPALLDVGLDIEPALS